MTIQRLSSERIFDGSFFKNLMRRRTAHILLAFLMNFFTLSVPIIMTFGNFSEQYPIVNDIFVRRATDRMQEIMVLNLVFTFAFAVYLGVITLGYMMNRRSAHFYHALPQKRETLYMTSIASALLCAAIGAVINLVIATVELFVFEVAIPEVISTFATLLFKNLIFFITTYAITLFAGSFSGNGLVQVLMTLVIMVYPLAAYYGTLILKGTFAIYFNVNYYFENEIIEWLSPFAYATINYLEGIRILPTIVALLVTVVLTLGGNEIYRHRAIENSERPIVFKKLGSVLKYMLMFVVTIFAGMFFYAIGYSILHMIFGFICGAVLSFMLFNTILEKTPKAMFKGIKGLAIFAAAFAVFALVFSFDIFNMDEYIPDADNISYAEISVGNIEYDDNRFDSPEMLDALVTVLENQISSNNAGVATPNYSNRTRFRIVATMYNKLGMPIARAFDISKYTDGVDEFLKLYANDGRMNEAFEEKIEFLRDMRSKGYKANYSIRFGDYRSGDGNLDEFVEIYASEFGVANYDRLSQPLVGELQIYDFYNDKEGYVSYGSNRSFYNELPIFEDMEKTIAFLKALPYYDDMTGEYKYPAEVTDMEMVTVEKVEEKPILPKLGYLYDTRELISGTGAKGYEVNLGFYPRAELDEKQVLELYEIAQKYSRSYSSWNVFTAIDKSVVFRVYYDEIDKEMEEKYGETYSSDIYIFPLGKVPTKYKALFN